MGILVGVRLHPSLHEYPGSMPDTAASARCRSGFLPASPGGPPSSLPPATLDWRLSSPTPRSSSSHGARTAPLGMDHNSTFMAPTRSAAVSRLVGGCVNPASPTPCMAGARARADFALPAPRLAGAWADLSCQHRAWPELGRISAVSTAPGWSLGSGGSRPSAPRLAGAWADLGRQHRAWAKFGLRRISPCQHHAWPELGLGRISPCRHHAWPELGQISHRRHRARPELGRIRPQRSQAPKAPPCG
jgi:hypothetical protein